jgi:hypothetical protein
MDTLSFGVTDISLDGIYEGWLEPSRHSTSTVGFHASVQRDRLLCNHSWPAAGFVLPRQTMTRLVDGRDIYVVMWCDKAILLCTLRRLLVHGDVVSVAMTQQLLPPLPLSSFSGGRLGEKRLPLPTPVAA